MLATTILELVSLKKNLALNLYKRMPDQHALSTIAGLEAVCSKGGIGFEFEYAIPLQIATGVLGHGSGILQMLKMV